MNRKVNANLSHLLVTSPVLCAFLPPSLPRILAPNPCSQMHSSRTCTPLGSSQRTCKGRLPLLCFTGVSTCPRLSVDDGEGRKQRRRMISSPSPGRIQIPEQSEENIASEPWCRAISLASLVLLSTRGGAEETDAPLPLFATPLVPLFFCRIFSSKHPFHVLSGHSIQPLLTCPEPTLRALGDRQIARLRARI